MIKAQEQPKWRWLETKAWVKVETDDTPKACTVTNVCQKGAVIIVDDALALPLRFWLWLTPDGTVKRECDATRRSKQFVEVDFSDLARAGSGKSPDEGDNNKKKSSLPQKSESSYAFSSRMSRLRLGGHPR